MSHFQVNDIVICKPADDKRCEENRNFEIYARVVEVNREKDTLRMDCYLKKGEVHMEKRILQTLPLSEMEQKYYQPMNNEEIIEFRDGLCKWLCNVKHLNYIDAPDVQATFDVINPLAERIEHGEKA